LEVLRGECLAHAAAGKIFRQDFVVGGSAILQPTVSIHGFFQRIPNAFQNSTSENRQCPEGLLLLLSCSARSCHAFGSASEANGIDSHTAFQKASMLVSLHVTKTKVFERLQ
jgi:hypothetical protein